MEYLFKVYFYAMEAEMGEDIGRYGIHLCSPGDRLTQLGFSFEAPPRGIPEIGESVLYGSREETDYIGKNDAIALLTNGVQRGNSSDFNDQGMYALSVWLQRMSGPTSPIVCRLTFLHTACKLKVRLIQTRMICKQTQ